MSGVEWIVCEQTGRWAAALRMAINRSGIRPTTVHEVRSLAELAARLVDCPAGLALMEVLPSDLGETLAWLPEARIAYPQARFAGLLDTATANHETKTIVAAVLRAAGAFEVIDSPRDLHIVLDAGRCHAEAAQNRGVFQKAQQSLSDWAWELLPWQPVKRPVA